MVSMKFNRRKKSSNSSTHDVSAQYAMNLSGKQVNPSTENSYAVPVAVPPLEETRDERNRVARFVDDASSAISTAFSDAVSEAASMATDLQNIIAADVPEIEESHFDGISESTSVETEPGMKVIGGPAKLAKLVKELGQKERKMEQLGKEFVKAQEDVRNTRKMIHALSSKVNLDDREKDNDDDDDSDTGSVVDGIVRFGKEVGGRVEHSATKVLFPYGELTV